MTTLANFVKTKRNEVKLTQEEFAERAGVALQIPVILTTQFQFKVTT